MAAVQLPYATRNSAWRSPTPECGTPLVELYQSTVDTTPEDSFLAVPTFSLDRQLAVVADARLDNREELAATLGPPLRTAALADAAFILAAYQKWGLECADHLDGDFAFILWDQAASLLLAARDLFGIRPLLYAEEDGDVVIASSIKGVLAGLRHRPAMDFDYLWKRANRADDLAPTATAYSSIKRLAPGHRLVVTPQDRRCVRYGELRPRQNLVNSPEDIFEEFRALLTRAVERRLRGCTPIGFMLSGGFDSSAIVTLADRAVAQGRSAATLRSYSAVYERVSEADERGYLQSVLLRCPHVVPTLFPSDHESWSIDTLDSTDGLELEEPPVGSRFSQCVTGKLAVSDGCRVVVTGAWADELLFRRPYQTGALFWGLSLPAMRRELKYFLRKPKPLARTSVPNLLRRVGSVAARLGLVDPPLPVVGALLRQRFTRGGDAALLADAARRSRWVGAETRMPFLDRRLHEFVMAVPPEYLFLPGRVKRLLRESLADLLPPEFQHRSTFCHVTPQIERGIRRELPRIKSLLASPLVVEHGLVTSRQILELVRRVENETAFDWSSISRILAVEVWLRRLPSPAQDPQRQHLT